MEFIANGMDQDRTKRMRFVAPDINLYYKCQVYYPEALFVVMALNDFIYLYAKKEAKIDPFPLPNRKNLWDSSIATVRLFQSEVIQRVKSTVTEVSYKRMVNLMHKSFPWMSGYASQYLDLLNIRYLDLDKNARKKHLLTIV